MNAKQKIVQVLGGFDEASGAQIARFFLLPWNMWPALLELERAKIIRSQWADSGKHPWMPRHRIYQLAIPSDQAKRIVLSRKEPRDIKNAAAHVLSQTQGATAPERSE